MVNWCFNDYFPWFIPDHGEFNCLKNFSCCPRRISKLLHILNPMEMYCCFKWQVVGHSKLLLSALRGISNSIQRTSTLAPWFISKVGPGNWPFIKIISLSNPSGAPFSQVSVIGKWMISSPSSLLRASEARLEAKTLNERKEIRILTDHEKFNDWNPERPKFWKTTVLHLKGTQDTYVGQEWRFSKSNFTLLNARGNLVWGRRLTPTSFGS
jgi:hypothetical protein